MHLKQVVQVRSCLLHEHCDELHLMQLTKITILLMERCHVFVVGRQLPIHLMSRPMQIVWWCIIVIPFPQRCMKIRPFATMFEGRRCWWQVAQLLKNEHFADNFSCSLKVVALPIFAIYAVMSHSVRACTVNIFGMTPACCCIMTFTSMTV